MRFPADAKKMKKALKQKWPPKKPQNDSDADDMPIKKRKVARKISSKPIKSGKKLMKRKGTGAIKTTGKFGGKSNSLGQGGRAAQLVSRGVPGGVIGNLARRAGAAPGQSNYHKRKK